MSSIHPPSLHPPSLRPPSLLPPYNFDPSAVSGIALVYDSLVADYYDDDAFDIIASSRAVALEQLRAERALVPGLAVCDFGVGTGECLHAIDVEHLTRAMWGVDVSARMIDIAREKLRKRGRLEHATFLQNCATRVGTLLPAASIDVAVSHFLLNYVDHAALARTVAHVSRRGGLWSIVTSQRNSFPVLATLARSFLPAAYDPDRHCGVPNSIEALEAIVQHAGFDIVARATHTRPLCFDKFDHALHFAKHSGWFASDLVQQVPDATTEALRQATEHMFPLEDEARVAVVLCRRR